MRPLGMDGSKSLQDLFTDRGVPRSLRHRLPVVTAAGRVVWVAGVRERTDRTRFAAEECRGCLQYLTRPAAATIT